MDDQKITIGLYAGSFNPFHQGHNDVVKKALKVFDYVLIYGYGDKKPAVFVDYIDKPIGVGCFTGLLKDLIANKLIQKPTALIRGLRNGNDLQYEQNMLYWNEDLGVDIPTVYFICDRKLGHISSSAIREIQCIKKNKSLE